MDLNELYFEHQAAVMRAGSAPSHALRRDGEFNASLIAGRIGCMQRALGAAAAHEWEALAAAEPTDVTHRSLALKAPGWRNG